MLPFLIHLESFRSSERPELNLLVSSLRGDAIVNMLQQQWEETETQTLGSVTFCAHSGLGTAEEETERRVRGEEGGGGGGGGEGGERRSTHTSGLQLVLHTRAARNCGA